MDVNVRNTPDNYGENALNAIKLQHNQDDHTWSW